VLMLLAVGAVVTWQFRPDRPSTVPTSTVVTKGERSSEGPAPVASGNLTSSRLEQRWDRQQHSLDPRNDGWQSEAFSGAVDGQLKRLGELLVHTGSLDPEKLRALSADNFSCSPLRPQDLEEVFRDKAILVRRPSSVQDAARHHGTAGLAEALRQLAQPLTGAGDARTKFKTVRVRLSDGGAQTSVYFQFSGSAPTGFWQINATWDVQWLGGQADVRPRLVSINVRDYEEVVAAAGRLFADCTEAVLGENPSFDQQIRYGLIHWLKRIERLHQMWVYARNGLAVGDVNGDGLEDLYLCQPAGLPNRLFIQNPDGTATDRSARAGVDWLAHTVSALLVDLDNDGDQDLVTAVRRKLLLMENDSTGRFRLRAELAFADQDCQSLSAVDYDNDGDLDLYLCVDIGDPRAREGESQPPFVYHDANNGGANVLFRNDITTSNDGVDPWVFTDVTKAIGLAADNRRHSLAAAWEDYDDDGDQDLYVANDYGPNWLLRNDGGHFVNVAREAGVVDYGGGMSVSWADYNRDGLMDLYVANMFSSAGSRITRQSQFQADADEDTRAIYMRFAKGNTLFENHGDAGGSAGPRFNDVGAESAVEMGRWAWSSPFVDLNNDGWADMVVANGFHTGEEETKDL